MNILEFPYKKINRKKVIIFSIVGLIILICVVLGFIYFLNPSARAFIDIHIFRKEINSNNLSTIEINPDEDYFYYAYDKYIALLNKNILYTYNSFGQSTSQNEVIISNPIFTSNNKFLAIAENSGNNFYLFSGNNILFQKSLDGNISGISVNKNGYVSIIISGTSYKSIIVALDSKGNEMFRTYLSNNTAICTEISNDNKYLSIAEIDYSGSIIKSVVRNISIETAKSDPTNSVISSFNLPENILLTNIKYQDKNTIICMCSDGVYSFNVVDSVDNKIFNLENSYEFIDINLKNNLLYTFNTSKGFSNISVINILNINNSSLNTYEFTGSIKSIYCNNGKIAINTSSEIHFIGPNGWLIKKYESYSEISTIILGDSIAGVVYRNRIEIIEI